MTRVRPYDASWTTMLIYLVKGASARSFHRNVQMLWIFARIVAVECLMGLIVGYMELKAWVQRL